MGWPALPRREEGGTWCGRRRSQKHTRPAIDAADADSVRQRGPARPPVAVEHMRLGEGRANFVAAQYCLDEHSSLILARQAAVPGAIDRGSGCSAPRRTGRGEGVGSSVHVGYEPQRVELRRPEFDHLVELLLIRVSSDVLQPRWTRNPWLSVQTRRPGQLG
eukprot:scaffold10725_cov76-Phaeocystis_antarctica.AAC.2